MGACDDDPSPIAPEASSANVQAANQTPGNDLNIENRFALDVDVDGSLKPGRPIHLTLRGTANFATKDADVRLSLPEVAAAEKGNWDVIEVPVGEETRPHIQLRREFEAGETFRERTTITIPEPGYYYVALTAKQHSYDAVTDLPHIVGDVSAKSMWLWIDERGGRVTEKFDTTLFAADSRKDRGPRTHKYKAPRIRKKGPVLACVIIANPDGTTTGSCGQTPDPTVLPPSPPPPPTSASQAVQIVYDAAGSGNSLGGHSLAPVPGARYVWRVTDAATNAQVGAGQGYADASGNLPLISCQGPTNQRNFHIEAFTGNDQVDVTFGSPAWPAGRYSGACGGSVMTMVNMYMAQTFINYMKTVERHAQVFIAPVPTKIRVVLNEAGNTHYWYHAPEIRIYAAAELIFGGHGVFVAAHEWGHWWQDKYLVQTGESNGLIRYYANCPRVHPPQHSTTLQCAVGEAFADWYAVVVRGADTGPWKQHLEDNFYHLTCQSGVSVENVPIVCTDDGSIVQGAVHAFLHDLTDDTPTEGHDWQVKFEPWHVAQVFKGCTVRIPGESSNDGFNGIDHMIYCMEQRSPYRVNINATPQTFFNTRSSTKWPQSVLSGSLANGWDPLRRTWLVNLYSKRVGNSPNFGTAAIVEPPTEPDPEPEPCPDPRQLIC